MGRSRAIPTSTAGAAAANTKATTGIGCQIGECSKKCEDLDKALNGGILYRERSQMNQTKKLSLPIWLGACSIRSSTLAKLGVV